MPPFSSAGDGALGSHSTQINYVSMLTDVTTGDNLYDVTTHYSPHVLIVTLQNETCPRTNDNPNFTACFATAKMTVFLVR